MAKRKFEVRGEDGNGDIWIVGSNRWDSAEAIAEKFREDGYTKVEIIENP